MKIKKIVCGFAVLGVLSTSGILSATQDAKAMYEDRSMVCVRRTNNYAEFWSYTKCYRKYNHRVNGYLNRCSDSQIMSWGEEKGSEMVEVTTFPHKESDIYKSTDDFYSHFTSVRVSSK